jgi:small neutral amino acid transporter SnatA (MarC family)
VLGFFGITLPALRIAGGIIVALSGWQLLNRSEHPGTITVAIALGAARAERSGIGVLAAIIAFFLATINKSRG